MNRNENFSYLKIHKLFPDSSIKSMRLKFECRSHRVLSKIPIYVDVEPIYDKFMRETHPAKFNFGLNFNLSGSEVRVIRLGKVEDLNPVNCTTEIRTMHNDLNDTSNAVTISQTITDNAHNTSYKSLPDGIEKIKNLTSTNRESKVPNIPMMIRCQNCDTNFPTKYQFQRHQCEFNAEKVVLKPNIDVRDVDKGMRMKYDCGTCGKQFVSKSNLERHLNSHNNGNANICEFCSKQFVSENRLRIHKENHCKKAGDISKFYRSDVTVWRCAKCYQVFSSDEFALTHVNECSDVVSDPIAIKNANENISSVLSFKDGVMTSVSMELPEEDVENSVDYENKQGCVLVEKVRTELLLQCEFCNRTYANKKSLVFHQDMHNTEINYNCIMCNATFESYVVAAKHWLTECANEANLFYLPKLIYCKCCDRTFKSHELLYMHKMKKKHYTPKKHHNLNNDAQVPSESQLPAHETNSDIPINQDCDANKDTMIKLIEGVLCSINHNLNDDETQLSLLGSESSSKHDEISGNNDVLGSQDSKSLPNVGDVELTEENTGKKRRGRKRKHPIQSKTKRPCPGITPGYKFQCERCISVFDSVIDLEVHRHKDHPANYKCEECEQVVHSSKALIIHSRAHQSLKPYVCEICKRCYSQTSHLWQHMRFHQGIKPFACPHEGCEARYTIRPDLKDHIRKVHTRERPFKCSVCDKCFLTGSVYYQHRLIHTNDRRYACDICHKRFFRADALNNHRRIHTDERPYPCNVCGRNFRQKGDRNKHVRTQHPAYA